MIVKSAMMRCSVSGSTAHVQTVTLSWKTERTRSLTHIAWRGGGHASTRMYAKSKR